MGGSSWSDDDYASSVSSKVKSAGTPFVHHAAVVSGKTKTALHPDLDPKSLKNGVRESRDSDAHPNSNAIIVKLDVTGSMGEQANLIHAKLPTLMTLLVQKSYIEDPQVLFGAVGDVHSDQVALQSGQFESGTEIESDISKIFIEGNGGGQNMESYDLALYFAARHTAIDCYEKRAKKGYMFIIGDEKAYPTVERDAVLKVFGKDIERDIPIKDIVEEAQKKYIIFFILPRGASHGTEQGMVDHWKKLLGPEHVLILEDANGVSELIATQIGLCEGSTDLAGAVQNLVDHGTSKALVKAVSGAVSSGYAGGAIAKIPPGSLTPATPTSGAKRL